MLNDKINEFTIQQLLDMSLFHKTSFTHIPFDLFLMHNYERELLWSFAKYIFPNNSNYLEIGSYAGNSALLVKETNPSINVTCIDPYFKDDELESRLKMTMDDLYYKTLTNMSKLYDFPYGINLIRGPSNKIIPLFKNNHFDVIFIDGNHSYDSVRKDILLSYQKIKNNGIIFGHDSSHNLVQDCIKNYIIDEIKLKNIPNSPNPYIMRFKDIIHRVIGKDDENDVIINDFWFARVNKN